MISHIYQDAKGYIWVATENGLNKYDGAKFTNYKNQFNDSPHCLGIMYTELFKTPKDIYTYFPPKDYKCMNINPTLSRLSKNSNSSYNNKSIAQLSDGSILIGTSGYGIKKAHF